MVLAMAGLAAVCSFGAAQTTAPKTEPADQTQTLDQQIAALVAQPAVSRDHWGVMVTALDGKPICSLNEAQLFQPASNAKLYTTAAAMALLGPDTTFETEAVVRGTSKATDASGILDGNLVLIGSGDANLSGRALPYVSPAAKPKGDVATPPSNPLQHLEEMADQVAAKGVKTITGDIVGDNTFFPHEPYPSDWSIDDAVWGYGAPVSALSIADNELRLSMSPGTGLGAFGSVTLEQAVPYYKLEGGVLTDTKAKATGMQVERLPGSRVVRIFGSMAQGSETDVEEIAIEDPAEYAALAFKAMLEARGIRVSGVARAVHTEMGNTNYLPSGTQLTWEEVLGVGVRNTCPQGSYPVSVTLAVHRGPTVREDITVTNKVSQNLHAELLLHHLGKLAYCKLGSTRAGLTVERAFLLHAGIDKDDFIFFDGSGLSNHDLVTPRATAKLLQYATTQPWFADWKASLPIGGEDGSLEERFAKPPLKDHLFAKTGTLGEARALSGYLDAASGRTVIFSIMVGNHLPGTNADRDAMDKIVAAIAAAE